MECFSSFIAIYNNLAIKDLYKIIAIKLPIEIRNGIYKNIQLNAVHKRCVVKLFMVIRNNQRIKITVQIICSVSIRTIKDDRNRIVVSLYIFNDLFPKKITSSNIDLLR